MLFLHSRVVGFAFLLSVAGALLAGAGAPSPALGQETARGADPQALLDRAHQEQRRFERLRRREVPEVWSGGSGGDCDERIGRMCLRYGEPDDYEPQPEPSEVVAARDALLQLLDSVAADVSGDGWLLGHRVWYRAEAGRWAEAAATARRCGAPEWWCDALLGFALHGTQRYPEAEAVFQRALSAMPLEQARSWTTPAWLLDRDARSWWIGEGGEESAEPREALFWMLADPYYAVKGNDRWTAHLSRHVAATVRERSANPYGLTWGDDLEQLLLRYGWEIAWERTRPGMGQSALDGNVIGHHHPGVRQFVPSGDQLRGGISVGTAWGLERQRPRAGYAPLYAPHSTAVEAQVARLRRGERLLVVGALAVPDSLRARWMDDRPTGGELPGLLAGGRKLGLGPPRAGVFLVPLDPPGDPGGSLIGSPLAVRVGGGPQPMTVEAPHGRYLASFEAVDPGRGMGFRHRAEIRSRPIPLDVPAVSDLLFLREGGPLPQDLEEALPRLLGRRALRAWGGLTVAWELYHVPSRDEVIGYRLTVEARERGSLRRAGEWLRILDRPLSVELAWQDPTPGAGEARFRAVDVRLPDLSPGEYRVHLEVVLSGRAPVATEAMLEIRP